VAFYYSQIEGTTVGGATSWKVIRLFGRFDSMYQATYNVLFQQQQQQQ